jgi:mono/diheme cytochrome c family protein
VTEIPEHLLKRSKERRAALGGDAGDGASADAPATPATAAVAKVESTAPAVAARAAAPAAPPPPKPDPAYIAAAKSRKKIPFWAMATLSLLPVWGFMYLQGVKPEAKVVHGPLGDGAKIYSTCATCHGSNGGGGVGRSFLNGGPKTTFPRIEDQLNLIYTGSKAYKDSGVGPYGDATLNHLGYNGSYMPPQGSGLTEAEILAVACHERYDLGKLDPAAPEYVAEFEKWCSEESAIYAGLEDGSITFSDIETKVDGVIPVGTEPRPGKTAEEAAALAKG